MNPSPDLQRRRVYDPLLRLIHAWNALAIVALLASAMLAEALEHGPLEDRIWSAHVAIGHGLAAGLALRLVWGLVGPASARFSDLWHPTAWRRALTRPWLPRSGRFGHDEIASLAYLALYGVLLPMTFAGLALAAIELGQGPLAGILDDGSALEDLFESVHEGLAWAVGGFVLLHLAALVYHQRVEGVPVAQSMLTGWQYRRSRRS